MPGDISSKGADFLAEAERLKRELPVQPSLTTLQGLLLLYERSVKASAPMSLFIGFQK